jgi:hypothetical protein
MCVASAETPFSSNHLKLAALKRSADVACARRSAPKKKPGCALLTR